MLKQHPETLSINNAVPTTVLTARDQVGGGALAKSEARRENKPKSRIGEAREEVEKPGRTLFYHEQREDGKTGVLITYHFSFDDTSYYLSRQKGGQVPVTLVLPLCRETLQLFKEHNANMY